MKGCRSLTDKEVEDVLNQLKSLRNKTLFLLGIKTGLRISEILSLTVADVVEHGQVGNFVNVARKNCKGKKEGKTLPLTNSIKTLLTTYLNSLGQYELNRPLFKSRQGHLAMTRMQAHRILADAFNALEMTGKISSHALRKTFAHKIHKAMGNQIEKTRVALNHKSLASTASYIQVDRAEVENAILGLG